MNVYAESSAVLAWLLGEKSGDSVRDSLRRADLVMSSDLTLIECDRVLIRAVVNGEVDEASAADRRAHLNSAARLWHLWRVSAEIIERARRPFTAEPVRTLDAIHLASALAARSAVPGIGLLSLDDRIRESAKQLGFRILPDKPPSVAP
ncbi:MAG TPA: type II toxin-antitoxin system VapC family toxin [Candidatus Baltobacteraceae bacterium]|nr:type II toxin-antitoxin system VapC family toxin [Candidatus Baltobacteraceae bacterium]